MNIKLQEFELTPKVMNTADFIICLFLWPINIALSIALWLIGGEEE